MRRLDYKLGNQRGLASIMVTTVLILVIGLIIVGFSQATRRNQRETLDRQLSTQAFYAAETGVNAAAAIASERFAATGGIPEKNSCSPDATYPALELDATLGVEVTCILVSSGRPSMYYSSVDENTGIVASVFSADSTRNIGSITLTWRPVNSTTTPSSGCSTSPSNNIFTPKNVRTCAFGVLRTDISQRATGSTSQTAMTFFANPVFSTLASGSIPNGAGGIGVARCEATSDPNCRITISGLNAANYYLRVRSLYRDATLTITATGTNGAPIDLSGQVLIDVTGKAQDVLRRIQVSVPLNDAPANVPNFALESTESICKRFSVAPRYFKKDTASCRE